MLREVVKAYPQMDVLYLGDHARAPYGDRDPKEIRAFTKEAVAWLFAQGCDEILFACNTASSIVLPELQDDRIFGIVEPTLAWLRGQQDRRIGLLATQATVDSGVYTLSTTVEQACPAWSILIENGDARTDEARDTVRRDVERLLATDPTIDTIVLACRHYPIFHQYVVDAVVDAVVEDRGRSHNFTDRLNYAIDDSILDQGQMLVDWMRKSGREPGTTSGVRRFYTTGEPDAIAQTAAQAFGALTTFKKVSI